MKIISNLPAIFKLLAAVRPINKYIKPIAEAKASGDFEKEREYIIKCTSYFGPKLMESFNADFNIHGKENLPTEGPVVIMANHQGNADILAMLATFTNIQFGFIAKKELASLPLFGKWIVRIRSIFIDRDDARASLHAIQEGIEYIKNGFSLCIFPEGTRSKGPVPGKFMGGGTKLAVKPGVPIIPVSINGTYRMMEETGTMKGARVDVLVHEPILTAGISRAEEKLLTHKIEEIIVEGVQSLQKYQPDYKD